MMNTRLSNREVLKIGCGFALFFLSFFIPSIVYAGELNAEEARVIRAARGTFEYDGKKYRALDSYINEMNAYLIQDETDLTSQQADELINEIYASIEEGVSSGYLYEIKKSTDEESGGNEAEDKPDQNNDVSEDEPDKESDVSEDEPDKESDKTEDEPNQTDEVSEDRSNETLDVTEEDATGEDDTSAEEDKSAGNNQSSNVSQETFRATGFNLAKLKYLGLSFSVVLVGMFLATVLLKRNINRGEHDK